MTPHRLSVRCVPFSEETLEEEIRIASRAGTGSAPEDQVRFLASYLANPEATARTILIEAPYVDRHFLEEYAHYYATTLHPPPPKATRLHFFKTDLTDRRFRSQLRRAANGKFEAVCKSLSNDYLGFTVIRPLPDAPLGRTILRTYAHPAKRRCYTLPPHAYRIHLCGLRLGICGIPFQQQEQGVGACATTAVWSALAQVMRNDGGRAPTPFAVTEAATKHWVSDRVFPASSGLKDEQILESIRQFGYSPLVFYPNGEPENFFMGLKCYLRSGIPVILKIYYPGEKDAHAVTLVGFREGNDPLELVIRDERGSRHSLLTDSLTRLYVHDDRYGPYARAEWKVKKEKDTEKLIIQYLPNEPGFDRFLGEGEIIAAMVPLYPKIRLSAQDLIGFAGEFLPIFPEILPPEKLDEVRLDLRFALAGDFLENLLRSELPADRVSVFSRQAVLSRYVGILRFSLPEGLIAYLVCDSTDMRRDAPAAAPLLAVLPRYAEHLEAIKIFAKRFGEHVLVA